MSGHLKYALIKVTPGSKPIDSVVMDRWPQTHRFVSLDRFAVRLSQLGEVSAVWFALAVLAFVVERLTTRQALFAVGGIVAEWVLTNRVVKAVVWRPRPTPLHADPIGVRRPNSSSLPSGHSSASAFAATFVGSMSAWWLPMAVLAFLLGCSRAHLRVHYPTDVLIGWLWGLALGASSIALSVGLL
jgi:undecaprenyl-diphosphatase